MEQYIRKFAIIAEIEKLRKNAWESFQKGNSTEEQYYIRYGMIQDILSFINTLKVKEVQEEPVSKDMQEALRMEYEKGRADVLRCIDPDEMMADFYSQPLSKTRSLASIYRQGIIDILKRINRNEETSITGTHSIDDGGVQLPKP